MSFYEIPNDENSHMTTNSEGSEHDNIVTRLNIVYDDILQESRQ